MPKLKFKLPEIETQNLSLICGPVNSNIEQIENSLAIKIKSRGNSFSINLLLMNKKWHLNYKKKNQSCILAENIIHARFREYISS